MAKDPSHGGRKKEKKNRTETWIKLAIKPEEIKLLLNDMFTKLTEENGNLRATVEDSPRSEFVDDIIEILHALK